MKARGKKPRRIPRKILEAIAEALKEIEAHFQFAGFGDFGTESETEAKVEDASEGVEPEEDEPIDDAEEFTPYPTFSFEEVEVSIDLFISELVQSGVIGREIASSFAEVFEYFFGPDHQITKNAQAFEEEIEGYFGSINYEDMQSAYMSLTQIRTILNQEMGGSATK